MKINRLLASGIFASAGAFAQQPAARQQTNQQPAQQQAANRPTIVAGFPVNYSEDSVGNYTLPELLKTSDGKAITTAKQWTEKRRPELLRLVEENQFGKMPGRPNEMTFNVFDKGTLAFNGRAVRKQVTVYFKRIRRTIK
ncbi:hypothetical protein GCM10010967_35180 [Dyadobacter beijingensis]|uniref:Uncharacterized protein n=1 Tax=Dyadobacter beijingensis TaxID=365489 RepID=A0ABQ2I249_9BACT|nr:hypothetical protein [Dyadobacter beijingensis]GGM98301.1 hypothetical protein GCM10010967_35180 [Dyadobacter beijingensis]